MRHSWANIALLILLIILLVTGFGGLISGSESFSWVLWLHGVGGYTIFILLFWKGIIIFDAFKRRWSLDLPRLGFLVLTVLSLATLATGLIWTYAGPTFLFGFSLMVIHGTLAGVLAAFLIWHILARWFVFRTPTARDRRAFLRLGGTGLAGLALWQIADPAKEALDLPGPMRRFTGSYETGSLTGVFPQTSWLFDYPQPIALEKWQLVIEGAVERPLTLTYAELEPFIGDTTTELLDCTGGWYSTQEWTGINVAFLLNMAGVNESARSVTIEGHSGYGRRFPLAEIRNYLLATHVAGKPLSHGHGFPLRVVAPGQRGFDWIKWVTHIRVNETSHLWQPPVPLQ